MNTNSKIYKDKSKKALDANSSSLLEKTVLKPENLPPEPSDNYYDDEDEQIKPKPSPSSKPTTLPKDRTSKPTPALVQKDSP